jgi:hypothetical protein
VAPPVDIFQWDAGRLPLKTSSVDVVVTDLVGNWCAVYILEPRLSETRTFYCRIMEVMRLLHCKVLLMT